MLKSLNIKNFAVIQGVKIDFQYGLTLLTGETGSGKSIIIDALGVLLGGRSSIAQIRTGEKRAVIEGVFWLTGNNSVDVQNLLGVKVKDETEVFELVIRRELSGSNRNRIFINQQAASVSVLRAIQRLLVETHGQGEQRALLSTQSHLDLLDQFAGCSILKREVSDAYFKWRTVKEALTLFERETAERERGRDFLQFQLSELEKLAPKTNEDEELQAERRLLTHAETVFALSSSSYLELYESDESILSRLSSVRRSLEELSKIDRSFETSTEIVEGCIASLSDIAETLRFYGTNLQFSPTRLAEIEDRLATLERFKRKYNTDIRGIFNILDELSKQLGDLGGSAEKEMMLKADLEAAEARYKALATKLSSCRKVAKSNLEQHVMNNLKHVAMENAQFIVALTFRSSGASDNDLVDVLDNSLGKDNLSIYSFNGFDHVEFLLSANQGESPRPLAFVASGGELSRLMLTLRTIGKGTSELEQRVDTLIFDEVDVGIGGRVAEAVGQRLKNLAASRQVLCVTHQPQIARFADHHYLIEKLVEKGRTKTTVKDLDEDERIGELARMISGNEQASAARETARWLLSDSNKKRGSSSRSKKLSKL